MRVFDSGGKGFVRREEFKRYMRSFTDEELTEAEIEKLLSDADLNGDGRIDYAEFRDMIHLQLWQRRSLVFIVW